MTATVGYPPLAHRRRPGIEGEFGGRTRATLLLGFAVLICMRMPGIILHGRFWADEGPDYFRWARELPWDQAILHLYSGYLNLIANAAALLAGHLVPLPDAPYVTIAVALCFQACPAILIVTSRDPWLQPRWAMVAALLIVATPPLSAEVWLNSITSQFHLALAAGLILAMTARGPAALRRFRLALLFLGPLSGPASIVLLPFFVLRAAIERSRDRAFQVLAIGAATALQIGLFYTVEPARAQGIAPALFACVMVVRHLLVPLLGWHAEIIGARIRWDFIDGQVPWAGVATFVVLICLMLLCAFRCRRLVVPWLMIPGLAIAWLSYYGALDKRLDLLLIDVGERYAFVPQVLFGLTLVAIATQGSEVARRVAAIAVAWIVMVGVAEYTLVGDHFINGPDWALEVALWRADPAHHLQIWPRGWEIVLPAYAN